jgi:hypothetical protein
MSNKRVFETNAEHVYPVESPDLSLDFINSRGIDPAYSFTRNSAATYVGPDGLIKTAAVNQPRFDFDPVTGDYRGLLIEESRTNNITNSNVFTSGYSFGYYLGISLGKSLITPNTIDSPLGPLTGSTFSVAPDASPSFLSSTRLERLSGYFPAGTTKTLSVFAKAGNNGTFKIFPYNENPSVIFNLNNGTFFIESSSGLSDVSMIPYKNGWYRCSATTTRTQTNDRNIIFWMLASSYSDFLYIAGAQFENGSSPTSYIPTTTTTVTRQPDQLILNKTLNTQGTLYVESRPTTGTPLVADNGSSLLAVSQNPNQYSKSILYYNTDRTLRMSSDGGVPVDFSSFFAPQDLNRVSLGFNRLNNSSYINGHLKKFSYYSSPLTEDNLRALTGNKRSITRVTSFGEPIVTSGLVLYLDAGNPASYPGSGTTWTDLSGNGNNGTLVNGVGYNSGNGGSLVFDGANDFVISGLNLNLLPQVTFSGWVYTTRASTNCGIMGNDSGSFGRVIRCVGSKFQILNTTTTAGNSTLDIPLNRWFNVVVTWSTSAVNFYLNFNEGQNTFSGEIATYNDATSTYFGSTGGGAVQRLLGNIAKVSIYNRALTAAEIQQNFNATRNRFGI